MHELFLSMTGIGVGFMVGLTGIGGGALMTPILVLVFGIDPLTAVSSDLVASLVMKPVGSAVHAKEGTIHRRLVAWLSLGSMPAAFAGVLILKALGDSVEVQHRLKLVLGVALLLAVGGIALKGRLTARRVAAAGALEATPAVKVLPTVVVGLVGGLMVGMTSVGAGSLMIVLLMLLYPRMDTRTLVGTDLAQAIPLVAAATFGHLLFGSVEFALAGWLLLGAIPGVYAGARISSTTTSPHIRPVLMVLLLLSATKLLGASTNVLAVMALVLVAGAAIYVLSTRRSTNPAAATIAVASVSHEGAR
ncbi:MAG: sulfite exporter TauE/SafE family protein [Ilumatobacteraceae bacterium]